MRAHRRTLIKELFPRARQDFRLEHLMEPARAFKRVGRNELGSVVWGLGSSVLRSLPEAPCTLRASGSIHGAAWVSSAAAGRQSPECDTLGSLVGEGQLV